MSCTNPSTRSDRGAGLITLLLLAAGHLLFTTAVWAAWPLAVQGASVAPLGSDVKTAVTPDGSVYLAGTFRLTATFGPGETRVATSGGIDVFVAKYTELGDLDWVAIGLSDGLATVTDLQVDSQGGVYLLGAFGDSILFGEHAEYVLGEEGPYDVYLAKIASVTPTQPGGPRFQWQWAQSWGTRETASGDFEIAVPRDLAIDEVGQRVLVAADIVGRTQDNVRCSSIAAAVVLVADSLDGDQPLDYIHYPTGLGYVVSGECEDGPTQSSAIRSLTVSAATGTRYWTADVGSPGHVHLYKFLPGSGAFSVLATTGVAEGDMVADSLQGLYLAGDAGSYGFVEKRRDDGTSASIIWSTGSALDGVLDEIHQLVLSADEDDLYAVGTIGDRTRIVQIDSEDGGVSVLATTSGGTASRPSIGTDGLAQLYVAGVMNGTVVFGSESLSVSSGNPRAAFLAQLDVGGNWADFAEFFVGEPVVPPMGVAAGVAPMPEISGVANASSYFYWDGEDYYPVRDAASVRLHWPQDGGGEDLKQYGVVLWPASPQRHMVGSDVELVSNSGYTYQELHYSDSNETTVDTSQVFRREVTGYSTLRFDGPSGAGDTAFEVVSTVDFGGLGAPSEPAVEIGTEILVPGHTDTDNAFLASERPPIDAYGAERAFNPSTRTGQIIPVNVNGDDFDEQLVLVGYADNAKGVRWPSAPYLYQPVWPASPLQIVIKDELGSETAEQPLLDPADYFSPRLYVQNDPGEAGFNPNDEHAILAPSSQSSGFQAVFALREQATTASEPYVLLKYKDPDDNLRWKIEVYRVTASGTGDFTYDIVAGGQVPAPYPLALLGGCADTLAENISGTPYFQDERGAVHAQANGEMRVRYFYPLHSSFYYDPDDTGEDTGVTGECVEFVDQAVQYRVDWPDEPPNLFVGETLIEPKRDMPDILHQASVEVVFQGSDTGQSHATPSVEEGDPTAIVKLFDALSPRWVEVENTFPVNVIDQAPYYLKVRLEHDPVSLPNRLAFKGYYDASLLGADPLLLINVMSERERDLLLGLSANADWQVAIESLYDLSRDPSDLEPIEGELAIGQPEEGEDHPSLLGAQGVLSAGAASATGYVTLAFNDDASLDPAALPISLQVMKVVCAKESSEPDAADVYYQGTVHTMPSDNVFDERLTLRHSGDFGGDPERYDFEWQQQVATDVEAPALPPEEGWTTIPPGPAEGVVEITISGASEFTISDSWVISSYQAGSGTSPVCGPSNFSGDPSGEAKLAEGWIKRVIRGLDPFRARTTQFHTSPTATYASMIEQAGEPYAGPVAFNGDSANVNQLGLIETYESVLRRGMSLSIDNGLSIEAANTALLLAAGRIADLTMLLGNEAWADAQDPTIGFGTQSGVYGSLAPTIFAFQNQLPSLLSEELALLRGRDDSNAAINLFPVYNRLIWNIETGDVGEAAYSQIYNLRDRDLDGFIDAADARIQFPQGHGDAWGYYTSALGGYYRLLQHPDYVWVPRAEAVNVAGTAVPVDYRDERKFAAAAAARARTGAEIASLAYREDYVEDPAGQWQGYKDPDETRAWGLSGWSRRAGHGAFFDWVSANALLPEDWQAPGAAPCPFDSGLSVFLDDECIDDDLVAGGYPEIGQIDRSNVPELREITEQFGEVQTVLDRADAGLNPIGLARGVVPFDIDPTFLDVGSGIQGLTHFEQIETRAREAMKSAVSVFNHASRLTESLRRNQDTLTDFSRNLDDRERDLRNRLIEIFGYPYADDIGGGGTYPPGYDDADLYHYMVVDPTELIGQPPEVPETVTTYFTEIEGLGYFPDPNLNPTAPSITIEFTVDRDGLGIVKPADWTGSRKAPGEVQRALSEYYQAVNLYEQALAAYDTLLADIDSAIEVLEAQYDLNATEIDALSLGTITTLNRKMFLARTSHLALRRTGEFLDAMTQAQIDGLPKVAGFATDPSGPMRALIATAGIMKGQAFQIAADAEESTELRHKFALDEANAQTQLTLETARGEFEVVQRVEAIEKLIRSEPALRLEIFNRREIIRQSLGNYQQTLARGLRLIDELTVLRRRAAADVQQHRYQDMAFRVARNDALQKYRAQFDLAARYVYLAASAYDYETNLLGSAGGAGREFLTDVVRHRSLGQVVDGVPQAGSLGLADPLARLGLNFQVIKGQLGFNNPQTETTRFSLRSELVRADSDDTWRGHLEMWRVDNLWDLPQFRRFARPFAPEPVGSCTAADRSGCEPALVIGYTRNGGQAMGTQVTAGLNYFGFPLGAGDSAYDATNFSTRIRTVGVWLTGYESAGLSATPSVYVLPVGEDELRSPTAGDFTARHWSVVDQVLPVPFPVGATSLDDPLFIPINDSLSGVSGRLGDVRRLSSFRAYPDNGSFDPSQTTTNSRLIGRSVANTRWLIIIPGRTLLADPDDGLDEFIEHVSDVKLFFQTYAYSGN